ncbi:hypothetical protein [uncultured Fibrobacter sp.]|jgi:hypothetical protein|uniref:hypothetical protein n=1 Tax=uncultured Fibrobacter sp. TaxID=261512 RepID=UPI0025EF7662|nr:hypothetical protein [uncultured Fibrobacter sp.]
MSSKFTTPLILSSALALSAFGLIACGEDSNPTVSSQPGTSSSYVPPEIPQETATTTILFLNTGVSSTLINRVDFTGTVKLDFSDTTANFDVNAARFTDIQFFVESASKTSTGSIKTQSATLDAAYFAATPVTTINFDQIGLYADLNDGYTECGNFNLIIAAIASTATATGETLQSVSRDTIPFVRDEENCKIPESSSSSVVVPGAPLAVATTVLNTKSAKCLTFATGTTGDTGDICISRVGKDAFTLSSGTGLKFAFYTNPNDADRTNDWTSEHLPAAPTTDNFKYKSEALKETIANYLNELEVFTVGIADTYVPNSGSAVGFYAFVVSDVSTPDGNGDVSINLTYLKAQ